MRIEGQKVPSYTTAFMLCVCSLSRHHNITCSQQMSHRTAHTYSHRADVYVTMKLCTVARENGTPPPRLPSQPFLFISQPYTMSHF